jgi:phage-related tail protein
MVDWAEVNFIIGTNPDNFIEIKFDQKSVDTDLGLRAYMNTMITTHEVISQFNLKRILKFWGFKDEKHIYFMLAPSWIKFNPAHVYSSVLNSQTNSARDDVDKSGSTNNIFKLSHQLNKSGNVIKDPQLYSKDIEV